MVGAAARIRRSGADGRIAFARVGITGLAGKGFRAHAAESRLVGLAGSEAEVKAAVAGVADGVEAMADIHASAPYRSHLARVAAARAVMTALARAAR